MADWKGDFVISIQDVSPEQRDVMRYEEACRRGDGLAAILLARIARRHQDERLLEIAMAGALLCDEPGHPVKNLFSAYMGVSIMVQQGRVESMWEASFWTALDHLEDVARSRTHTYMRDPHR